MTIWIGFTNQKLYQSRLLMEQADQVDMPVLAEALEAAALQHLLYAWRGYLNELGAATRLQAEVENLQQLQQQTSLVTGEMQELQQLLDDPFSWLSAMLVAAERLGWPERSEVRSVEVSGLITSSRSVAASPADWWKKLSGLIDRQRENRLET